MSHLFILDSGALRCVVDADFGGHIVEFSWHGKNALACDRPEIGSTFWPAPEAFWGWPPPKVLDKAPYNVVDAGDTQLVIESGACDLTGLSVRKRFCFNDSVLGVEYRMTNTTGQTLQFAPWEITRILGGLTFYASDSKPLQKSSAAYKQSVGVVWHHYQPSDQNGENQKMFGNGSSGWVANAHEGLLLLKTFTPISATEAAPGEAEIEIYAHGDMSKAYIEMEQQVAYKTIKPGENTSWRVNWHLLEIPDEISVQPGSTELLQFVSTHVAD